MSKQQSGKKNPAASEPYPVLKKNTEKQSPTVQEDESVTQ